MAAKKVVKKVTSRTKHAPRASDFKHVARKDVLDFRDRMFIPTLVEVPLRITLDEYKKAFPSRRVPVLDQGTEGSCTGFGLAAVANFLLHKRKIDPDQTQVSPHMLYALAKRYDEWPGDDYDGSSARGAVKAWHKHGVCAVTLWGKDLAMSETHQQAVDALKRPLGAYFRVNHMDLVAMHAALAEVGALYATATVHTGWDRVPSKDGRIPYLNGDRPTGGHAFAIVGYDEFGFWIQNSWGSKWGKGGFAQISYEDWLKNATDVWVARLGARVAMSDGKVDSSGASQSMLSKGYTLGALRPHVIGLGNNGSPRTGGELGTSEQDIERIFLQDFPRITKTWKTKRVLFYAHGGLVDEKSALQRVEDYRQTLLDNEIYPIAFVWRTDFWNTIKNLLSDLFRKRRSEGVLDVAKDFMLDRIDESLEVLAAFPGGVIWKEMKENALAATTNEKGGVRLALTHLKELLEKNPSMEVHLAAHSAGSILLAPLAEVITTTKTRVASLSKVQGLGARVSSCTLWAPACSLALFRRCYLPAIKSQAIKRFALFTLKDAAEQEDNCASIYNKSLLYLVSNAFELQSPLGLLSDGEPILGMEKFILKSTDFEVDSDQVHQENPSEVQMFGQASAAWIRCPNGLLKGDPSASLAREHGAFDDDTNTVYATLRRILGHAVTGTSPRFEFSPSALADRRRKVSEVMSQT